jgi:hypothetical protein
VNPAFLEDGVNDCHPTSQKKEQQFGTIQSFYIKKGGSFKACAPEI